MYSRNYTTPSTVPIEHSDADTETSIEKAHLIQYYILQLLQLLSAPCYLFLFYHYAFTPALRKPLYSHVIILLLIVNFITLLTDLSILLNFFRTGVVWPSTPSFCLFWMWIETTGYNLDIWLMTWASMERHILVFHNNWIITFKQHLLTHYIPITLCVLYGLIYSAYLVFGYPCQDNFDYGSTLCGYSCAYGDFILSQYDTIANSMTTIFLIVLFTLSLLFRVLWQKRQFRQGLQWRKNRKMIIQLLSISSIYLIADLPINISYLSGYPASDTIAYDYLSNMMYLVRCLLPYICLTCLPEVWQKLKMFQHKIRPMHAFGNTAGTTQTIALRTLPSSLPPLE